MRGRVECQPIKPVAIAPGTDLIMAEIGAIDRGTDVISATNRQLAIRTTRSLPLPGSDPTSSKMVASPPQDLDSLT
jgi:hypothetical protein